jgi:hypothetical protein
MQERMLDGKGDVEGTFSEVRSLEEKKAEILTKINALNTIRNSVSNNIDNVISINTAGVEDVGFNASVSEIKSLYKQKAELSKIYTPQSEPMREINRLINEAKSTSFGQLRKYYDVYNVQLGTINGKISNLESELGSLPYKQKKYLDAERGYTINEATYNLLLTKLSEAEMRLKTNVSDISVIDKAKNLKTQDAIDDFAKKVMEFFQKQEVKTEEQTKETKQEEKPVELLVAAAASLEYSYEEELLPMFEKENPNITVKGTYDSSGKLQTQIEEGIEADVTMDASIRL